MKKLNESEIDSVNGGILPAFIIGITLGQVAKKLYNKYG